MLLKYAPIEAGALSVAGFEQLLERLPAEVRARLKWSPVEMRVALTAFLDGAQNEPALRQLVGSLLEQFARMGGAFQSLAAHPEVLRPALEEGMRRETETLRKLPPSAALAAEWAVRTWMAFVDVVYALPELQRVLPELSTIVLDDELRDVASAPGSPLRAQALIMAAIESAGAGRAQQESTDLVLRAFDEVVLLQRDMLRQGVRLDPFRGETLAERGARLSRYAEELRNELSAADEEVLEDSRLRSL